VQINIQVDLFCVYKTGGRNTTFPIYVASGYLPRASASQATRSNFSTDSVYINSGIKTRSPFVSFSFWERGFKAVESRRKTAVMHAGAVGVDGVHIPGSCIQVRRDAWRSAYIPSWLGIPKTNCR
jgi:hypothetical protein